MDELRIDLIAIGDELLVGHTLDTNSHWIARRLVENGLRLRRLIWSSDQESDILANLSSSWKEADVVIFTGGLGPTHDDITRPAIAGFFSDQLIYNKEIADSIRRRYLRRGIASAPGWEAMAMFPKQASPIPNEHGAAPGIHYMLDDKELYAVPGVPIEMRGMLDEYIIPRLIARRKGTFQYCLIRTTGIGESHLAALIGDPRDLEPIKLAFLPSVETGVTLRLSCFARTPEEASAALAESTNKVTAKITPYIYGMDEQPLEAAILDLMRQRKLKIAVAESCTGGMICSRFVSVPGSSDVLERGYITYSNDAKRELLGVSEETLNQHGAVSAETAREMAHGARERASVDLGLAVTGIAGPSGGSVEKPVGLVYIGISDSTGTDTVRYQFAGDREDNRRRATLAALTLIYNRIKSQDANEA